MRSSNGCEIRFVSNKPSVRLYLRSLTGDADLVHLYGNHVVKYETLEAGKIHCLELGQPQLETNRDPAIRTLGGFAPNVYRIVAVGATLAYHGVDALGGDLRAPTVEECPPRRWLAYGSSITQSSGTFHSYVNAAAQMLEADAINLGMGGSCWIEAAIADFITGRSDWDFATFELGINMAKPGSDNVRFREKVEYLLDRVTSAHPNKPIFLITMFRHGAQHEAEASDWGRDPNEKDAILREVAKNYPTQVTLLEGTEIVPDFRGFQTDLVHPEPFAYARMGLKLAEMIENR